MSILSDTLESPCVSPSWHFPGLSLHNQAAEIPGWPIDCLLCLTVGHLTAGMGSVCSQLCLQCWTKPGTEPAESTSGQFWMIFNLAVFTHDTCDTKCVGLFSNTHQRSSFLDTSWVSHNSVCFWRLPSRVSLRPHRIKGLVLKTFPKSDASYRSPPPGCPLLPCFGSKDRRLLATPLLQVWSFVTRAHEPGGRISNYYLL